jgi:4-amino-4-deoxy-L-arabinose transferase-like glycosyltransferase
MLARSIVAGNGYRWYGEEDLELIERYVTMEVPEEYDPRGIPTSFRPPGYPLFLALVYALFGAGPHRFFAARLVQALVGTTLAPLAWALARRAGFGERTARWSATILAAFPLLVVYPLALATENLFVPLLALGLLLLLRAAETRRTRDHLLAGAVLGYAALTRSIVTAFTPLAALWLWQTAGNKRAGLRNATVVVLCVLLITLPWAVRNTILHGKPTWVESALGYDLYVGYHPLSTGTFTAEHGISLDLFPILDDAERHERGMEAFREFVRADPGRVPYLMVRKLGHLWSLDRRAMIYFYTNNYFGHLPAGLLGLIFALICGPLVVLAPAAVCGLICGRMDGRKALLALLLAYYCGVHVLILAEPRFHVPLFPTLAVLAAHALAERPWKESRPWQRALALLVIALLAANWGFEIAQDWDVLVEFFGPEGNLMRLPY